TQPASRIPTVWWRKAMHMLGLEDEGDYDDPHSRQSPDPTSSNADSSVPGSGGSGHQSTVVPISSSGQISSLEDSGAVGTPRPSGSGSRAADTGSDPKPVVRPVPVASNAKPQIVRPTSFDQAQVVADSYKMSLPVVMDLQEAERDLARRLIDFASGLCYGLG